MKVCPIRQRKIHLTAEALWHGMILRQERIHRRRFAVADATRHRVEVLEEFELYVILGGHTSAGHVARWTCSMCLLEHGRRKRVRASSRQ